MTTLLWTDITFRGIFVFVAIVGTLHWNPRRTWKALSRGKKTPS